MAEERINYDDLFASDLNKRIAELEKAITDLSNAYVKLFKTAKKSKIDVLSDKEIDALKKFIITQDDAEKKIKDYGKSLSTAEKEQRKLAKAQDDANQLLEEQGRSVTALKASLKAIKLEYDSLNDATEEGRKRQEALKNIARNLDKEIKEQTKTLKAQREEVNHAEDSYASMSKELVDLRKRLRAMPNAFDQMTGEINQSNKEAVQLIRRIEKLDKSLKNADAQMGNFQRNVGNYKSALEGLGDALGGVIGGVGGGGGGLDGISSLVGTLAPQLGIVAGAVIGVGEAFDFAKESAERAKKEINEVKQLIETTDAEGLRADISALSTTFNIEFTDSLQAVNSIMTDFGLDSIEATDLLTQSLLRVPEALRGEVIDQFREYSSQLVNAGFTAEQTAGIINTSLTNGAFSDKAIDAVKEFNLRIREMTDATSDALNPIEDQAEAQIRQASSLGDVQTALQLVTQELEKGYLSTSQAQTIIADVFGGPGEDLGFERLIQLGEGVNALDRELTDYEKTQLRVVESNKRLAESENELAGQLGDTGSTATIITNNFKILLNTLFTAIAEIFSPLVKAFQDITAGISNWFAGSERLSKAWEFFVNLLELSLLPLQQVIRAIGDFIVVVLDGITWLFDTWVKTFEVIIESLGEFFDWIVTLTKDVPILGSVMQGLKDVAETVGSAFNDLGSNLLHFRAIMGGITNVVFQSINIMSKAFQDFGTGIFEALQKAVQGDFKGAFDALVSNSLTAVNNAGEEIGKAFEQGYKDVMDVFAESETTKEAVKKQTQSEEVKKEAKKGGSETAKEFTRSYDEELSEDEGEEDLTFFDKIIKGVKKTAKTVRDEEKKIETEVAESADKNKQKIEEFNDFRAEQEQAFFNASIGFVSQLLDAKTQSLQAEKEMMLENFDKQIQGAGDNAEAIASLEAEKAQKQLEFDRKLAESKRRGAIFEKTIGITSAVIEGAKNIAIATGNYLKDIVTAPATPFVVGLIAATTALQVASIAAQPIPSFAEGVVDFEGGLAEVGEKGFEAIELPNSNVLYITPNGSSIVNLPAHTNVIDHQSTVKLLTDSASGQIETIEMPQKDIIDTDKIIREIAKGNMMIIEQLRNMPQSVWNITEDGLYKFYKSRYNKTAYANKRYKS